ncbi:hypothetical protein HMI54_003327, partial [Coelomomyces lativittatus]
MKLTLRKGSQKRREESYQSIAFTCNISDYVLLGPIGGIDDISFMYLAIFTPLHVLVALKYTDLTISPDPEFLEELTTVVSNTKCFRHSSLLPYFKAFIESERLWIVTLPMKAGSLRSILSNYFPQGLPELIISTVLKYVLHGLLYLHSQGIIHNDIRAENVHLDCTGDVRLVGLHQLTFTSQARKSAFDFSGLPEWISPELLQNPVSHDPRSDIYSLGIMAMELAYGKTPFSDWPALKILVGKLKYGTPLNRENCVANHNKPFSNEFFHFIFSCVQKHPFERPTAKELLDHSFLKRARDHKYLVRQLIKKTGIERKFDTINAPLFNSEESYHDLYPPFSLEDTSDGPISPPTLSKVNAFPLEDKLKNNLFPETSTFPLPTSLLEQQVSLNFFSSPRLAKI